ncbi:MAG: DsbA family oxidoreductase, partial [Pseudolysinimonas sp.]
MIDRVTGIAEGVGLNYDYDHVHQTNTVKAHELLHFAKAHGRQSEMKEALLKAYFLDGGHVGRIDDLADLAATLGFDRAEVATALTENRYIADVKADMAQAVEYGINGVPFYVFEGQYGVSGAQDTATFANVLDQVRNAKEPAA